MKVKKSILAALTVVCALLLFSSCGKQNVLNDLYIYRAYGKMSTSGAGGLFTVASFQSAIDNAVGDGLTRLDDAKVIAACDAVDAKIKAATDTKYSGYVEITRKELGNEGNGTVIKMYTY